MYIEPQKDTDVYRPARVGWVDEDTVTIVVDGVGSTELSWELLGACTRNYGDLGRIYTRLYEDASRRLDAVRIGALQARGLRVGVEEVGCRFGTVGVIRSSDGQVLRRGSALFPFGDHDGAIASVVEESVHAHRERTVR